MHECFVTASENMLGSMDPSDSFLEITLYFITA
jgi:hypothetical protein